MLKQRGPQVTAKFLLVLMTVYGFVASSQPRECAVKCVKALVDNSNEIVPIKGNAEYVNLIEPAVGQTPEERVEYMLKLCHSRYGGNAIYDDVMTATDPKTKARKIIPTVSHAFTGNECQPKIQDRLQPLPVRYNPDDDDVKARD